MDTALAVHRFHFAFTITYHYLFPQLTMGLALLMVVLKVMAIRYPDGPYLSGFRWWAKIFALNFAMGVVTGIPMEFQFGTNWSGFAKAAGGVIGQTLAMEGVFAFFLESSFLALVIFGEKRLGPKLHLAATVMLWAGTWLSGYFIVMTNAWMQHPVGAVLQPDGTFRLSSLGALLTNPWGIFQYLHTMTGAVATGAFAMAAVGAYHVLSGRAEHHGRAFVKLGLAAGLPAALLLPFPTGDLQARMVADHQPAGFAAMEGLFRTQQGAPLAILGQPDVERMRLDNPLEVPRALSFLTYRSWKAEVKGLEEFPRETWPQNIPMLYYAYHLMVGLGTIMAGLMACGAWRWWRGTLFTSRGTLWALMVALPAPYIANTTGWLTAELGRQPWLVYGLMKTESGYSTQVSAGNALFSLIGFMGVYAGLSLLFVLIASKLIRQGPEPLAGGRR